LGLFTYWYGNGASYLSNDPAACADCHMMRDIYDARQKSSHHAAAACNDCQVPHELVPKYLAKMKDGFWHSKGFTLQDFHEPIRNKPDSLALVNAHCRVCHESLLQEIVGAAVVVALATFVLALLLQNIGQRKQEANQVVFEPVKLTEGHHRSGGVGEKLPS
jgi:cytochrome c nitrite reductase small subunit